MLGACEMMLGGEPTSWRYARRCDASAGSLGAAISTEKDARGAFAMPARSRGRRARGQAKCRRARALRAHAEVEGSALSKGGNRRAGAGKSTPKVVWRAPFPAAFTHASFRVHSCRKRRLRRPSSSMASSDSASASESHLRARRSTPPRCGFLRIFSTSTCVRRQPPQ